MELLTMPQLLQLAHPALQVLILFHQHAKPLESLLSAYNSRPALALCRTWARIFEIDVSEAGGASPASAKIVLYQLLVGELSDLDHPRNKGQQVCVSHMSTHDPLIFGHVAEHLFNPLGKLTPTHHQEEPVVHHHCQRVASRRQLAPRHLSPILVRVQREHPSLQPLLAYAHCVGRGHRQAQYHATAQLIVEHKHTGACPYHHGSSVTRDLQALSWVAAGQVQAADGLAVARVPDG
mmetsp:Transcript_30082/g.68109  ORF Transcript_30082/g.68109 Transcript_30082/m.68109 type:complete len:236 (-) Transcript_30082:2754-3461(-)